ncbi:MAG: GNAT family N-acetyltransferase, partial [Thermoplasmata archaeon]|nr:GNAT family N-acetyltransferase [Thermoplasmata archaeon]
MYIEPATKLDAAEISYLYKTVWTPYRESFPADLMDNRISDAGQVAISMDSNEYFVIREENKIIGVVRCQFPHGTCHLDRMVVHPEHQGKGIGKALTQFIIDLAKEKGTSKVWLDTTPALEGAVALYESMGFKEVG